MATYNGTSSSETINGSAPGNGRSNTETKPNLTSHIRKDY